MYSQRQLIPILNALPVFEEAARLESFTRAGEHLGMSQPSVSRFISNLENHLEVQLFERSHNRLRLTVNGLKLYQATASGLDEIRQACSDLRSSADTRILTIECTHGFAHMWLLPRIHALEALLPGWKLRTISSEGGAQPASGEADLVVRLGEGGWEHEESLLLFPDSRLRVTAWFTSPGSESDRLVGAAAHHPGFQQQ
jgi:LysR family glycine cleavage system transcriptional activator